MNNRRFLLSLLLMITLSIGVVFADVEPPQLEESFVEGIKIISFSNPNAESLTLEYRVDIDDGWKTGFSLEILPEGENTIDFRYEGSNVISLTIFNENSTVKDIKSNLSDMDLNNLSISNYREKEVELSDIAAKVEDIETQEQRVYLEQEVTSIEDIIEDFKDNNGDLELEGLLSSKEIDDLNDVEDIYGEIDNLKSKKLLEELVKLHRESYQYRKESLSYLEQEVIRVNSEISSVEVYKDSGDEDYYIVVHMDSSSSVTSDEQWVHEIPELLYREIGEVDSLKLHVFGLDIDRKLTKTFNNSYFSSGGEGVEALKEYIGNLPTMYGFYNFDYKSSIENRDIQLRMYGDFEESEIEWDDSDFRDFLKFEVAKDLSLEFDKTIEIKVYDKDENLIEDENFYTSQYTHGMEAVEDLEEDLDDDYEKNQDLKFRFSVYSDVRNLYIRMEGYFKKDEDDWETKDLDEFLDYIEDIEEYSFEALELPVKLKVLDENGELLFENDSSDQNKKEDIVEDSALEYTLNGKYSYYPEDDFYVYYEIDEITDEKIELTLTVSDWDDDNDDEDRFEDWLYTGVDRYLKEETMRDIEYTIEDSKGNKERSYEIEQKLSSKTYELEQDLKSNVTTIGGYEVDKIKVEDSDIRIYLDEEESDIEESKVWDELEKITSILDSYYTMKFKIRLYDEDEDYVDSEYYTSSGSGTTRISLLEDKIKRFTNDFGGTLKIEKESKTDYIEYLIDITDTNSITLEEDLYIKLLKDYVVGLDVGQFKILQNGQFKQLVKEYNLEEDDRFDYLLMNNAEDIFSYLLRYKDKDTLKITKISDNNYIHNISKEMINMLEQSDGDIEYDVGFSDSNFKINYNLKDLIDELNATDEILIRVRLGNINDTSKIVLSKSIVLEIYADGEVSYPKDSSFEINLLGTPNGEKAFYKYDYPNGWDHIRTYTSYSTKIPIYIGDTNKYALLGSEQSTPLQFNDISDSEYKNDILDMALKGYINGVGNGKFNPKGYLTRGQFTKIITNVMTEGKGYYPATTQFMDVSKSSWYFPYVHKVVQQGIMQGIGNNLFNPEGQITEEEVLAVLSRELGAIEYNLDGVYPYQAAASSWSKELLDKLVSLRVVNPLDIEPKKSITREKLMHWLVDYEREYNGKK